jgi:hypothetical protein
MGDYWKQRDALERALRIKETQVFPTHKTLRPKPEITNLKPQTLTHKLQFGSDHFELAKTLANLGKV